MDISFLFLVLIAIAPPQANSWHGIVPLHSTRADVERILGSPTPDSKAKDAADYRTANERIFVLYSTGPCDVKPSNGWNAPRGTVIKVSVEPNVKPKLSDFKLDESKYEKNRDPELPDYMYYTDDENGIVITVNTAEGVLTNITYWPTSKENSLRCSTATENYQIFGFDAYKFAEYSNISWADQREQLDGFATLLSQFPSAQGHIIAYAGKSAHPGAKKLATRTKSYLVRMRGINSARLVTVDGGRREAATVELYLVPPGVSSPGPSLTVPSNEPHNVDGPVLQLRKHRSST
jgi:hypothetical protein